MPGMRLAGGGAVFPCLPFLLSEDVVHGQLIYAAKRGRIEQMHRLVRQGAHVNSSNENGQSPLIKAAERGQTEAVEQLLKLRADIKFVDRHQSTALHYAAFNGHTMTVIALASKGPDLINQGNKFGYTPLHYAAADGHAATVAALVSLGADYHHRDNMRLTALHRAAAGGHVAAVYELVKSGASVHGITPLSTADAKEKQQRSASSRTSAAPCHRGLAGRARAGIRAIACLDLLVSPVERPNTQPPYRADTSAGGNLSQAMVDGGKGAQAQRHSTCNKTLGLAVPGAAGGEAAPEIARPRASPVTVQNQAHPMWPVCWDALPEQTKSTGVADAKATFVDSPVASMRRATATETVAGSEDARVADSAVAATRHVARAAAAETEKMREPLLMCDFETTPGLDLMLYTPLHEAVYLHVYVYIYTHTYVYYIYICNHISILLCNVETTPESDLMLYTPLHETVYLHMYIHTYLYTIYIYACFYIHT